MICPYCRENIQDGAIKCRYCSSFIGSSSPSRDSFSWDGGATEPTPEEIRLFTEKNADYYLRNFSRFRGAGGDRFSVTWNWPACLFTFFWMLYRKMYLAAGITFLLWWIPGFNLLLHIAAGITGNYVYYRHVRSKVLELKSEQPHADPAHALREVGGVHSWVIPAGILAGIFIWMMMMLLMAGLFATARSFHGAHPFLVI